MTGQSVAPDRTRLVSTDAEQLALYDRMAGNLYVAVISDILDKLGYKLATKGGDGTVGWAEFAPFDGIIVTAGAPTIPDPLRKQLADGGRLVIPVGDLDVQTIIICTRNGDQYRQEEIVGFKFVPLIGKMGWK